MNPSPFTLRFPLLPARAVAALVGLLLPALASAATFNWDGGPGDWDSATPNWTGAGALWPATGTDNDAVFGGTAGTVSVLPPALNANDLSFTSDGYLIGGATLTLNGTTPTVTVGATLGAEIQAGLTGSAGLLKAGAGTLTLTGTNALTGSTTISGGTLAIGPGGLIRNGNQVFVGPIAGAGTLTLSGGHLYSDTSNVFGISIGTTAGQPGVFNVEAGTLSLANSGGGIVMGSGAHAQFNQTGGEVSIGAGLYLANGGGGFTSSVDIRGGVFTTAGTVRVGQTAGGTGMFQLSGGTFNQVNNSIFHLAENGVGTATVSGSGVLNTRTEMWIGTGANSSGTLNLEGGAINQTGVHLVVGGNGGGITAVYNQSGGLYRHTGTNGIYLGNSALTAGTMNLTGGTFLHTGAPHTENRIRVGSNTGGSGTLNVGGTASLITNAEMWIGGAAGTGAGTLNLSGGSILQTGQYLVVGNSATGSSFNQTGGSYLFTGVNGVYVGNGTSGAGTVTISGGTFTQTQSIFRVGQNGTSTATVNLGGGGDPALMTVPTLTFAANSANASGTFNLLANGTLAASLINRNGAGTFNFNGGTLRATASSPAFLTGLTAANVLAGGAVVDTAGQNITIGQSLLDGGGIGGLTKNGLGTLTLAGVNTYTGATAVNVGVVQVIGTLASPTLDFGVTYGPTAPAAAGLLVQIGAPDLTGLTVTSHAHSGTPASSTNYLFPLLALPGGFAGSPTVTAPAVANQSILRLGNTFFLTNSDGEHYLWNNSPGGTAISDGASFNTIWDATSALSWRRSNDGSQANMPWGGATEIAHFGVANGAAGTITVSGTVPAAGLSFNPAGSGAYVLSDGTIDFGSTTGTLTAHATTATVGAILAGSQGVTKDGSGGITLAGANAYTGETVLNQGTLTAGHAQAFAAGPVVIHPSATADFAGFNPGNPVTLNGGTLALANGASGPITLNDAPGNTINATGNYRVLSGKVTGAGGFTLGGTAIPGVTLANPANDFAGPVTVQPGAYLRLESDEVLPDTALVTVNGNLRLEANDATETLAGLSGNGSVWRPTSSSGTFNLRVGAGDISSLFPGTVGAGAQNNNLSLTKIGSGTLILNGANLYTGATVVTNGVLQVGNGATLGTINTTSGIDIGPGATLRWFRSDGSISTPNNHSGAGTLHFLGTNGPGALGQSGHVLTLQDNTTFTGTLVAERARVIATEANDLGAAALRVDGGGQFFFSGLPSFANPITVADSTGWFESAGNLSALRFQGTVVHQGDIDLNPSTRTVLGDNSGAHSVVTAYSTSDVTLSGILRGPGEFSLGRYTAWNGGTTQPVQIRLAGTASNTHAGPTIVNGQGGNASLWLEKTGGAVAIPGGTVVQMGNGTGGQFNLRMGGNEQFGPGVVMNFVNASGQWGRFDLLDTTQTLAGLQCGNPATQGGGVIQNGGLNLNTTTGLATLVLNGSGTYLYNGFLRDVDTGGTGVLALTKQGPGAQTLAGSVITHTGPTTVHQGLLRLLNATAFNSPVNLTGGVLQSDTNGANNTLAKPITGANPDGPVLITGNATTFLTADNTYANGTEVRPGATLSLGNNTAAGSVLGPIANQGTLQLYHANANPWVFSNPVTGAGVLNAYNTVAIEDTSITLGTGMNVGVAGGGSASVSVADASISSPAGWLSVQGSPLTLDIQPGANLTFYGVQTANGGGFNQINLSGGTLTVDAGAANGGGTYPQTPLNGAVNLAADSNSALVQTGGTLQAWGIRFGWRGGAASTGTFTQTGGTTVLGAGGFGLNVWGWPGKSAVVNLGGGTLSASANWSMNGVNATLSGDGGPVTFDTSGRVITANTVLSGPGGLVKTGAGSLIVSAANSYTGDTTVAGGTLALTGAGTLAASSNLTVAATGMLDASGATGASLLLAPGQTLRGEGSVRGALLVGPDALLDPGPALGPGVLRTENLDIQTGGRLRLHMNGPTPDSGHDQLSVTGTVSFAAASLLEISLGTIPSTGTVFTVVNNDGTDPVTGTLTWQGDDLAEGETFTADGVVFRIGYAGGDGNDVTLTALHLTYPAWIAGFPGLPSDQRDEGDDPDGDGLANLLEYFSALHPGVANPPMMTALDATPTTLRFTFRRSRDIADLTHAYEWSTDLQTWFPADADHVFTEALTGGDPAHTQVRGTLTCPAPTARIYAPLRITRTP